MKPHRLIYKSPCRCFRIIEVPDECSRFEDLEGEMFDSTVNPDVEAATLEADKRHFRRLVEAEGVWGYELEKWNPEPDQGWEHIDSCYGFVGQYVEGAEDFEHYIVDEMKTKIFVET